MHVSVKIKRHLRFSLFSIFGRKKWNYSNLNFWSSAVNDTRFPHIWRNVPSVFWKNKFFQSFGNSPTEYHHKRPCILRWCEFATLLKRFHYSFAPKTFPGIPDRLFLTAPMNGNLLWWKFWYSAYQERLLKRGYLK